MRNRRQRFRRSRHAEPRRQARNNNPHKQGRLQPANT
jgi:hypothetical protein